MMDAVAGSHVETSWDVATLEHRCRVLRQSCLARGVAPAVVEACAPGGEENAQSDPLGARIVEYTLLRIQLDRAEQDAERRRAAQETALTASLSNAPEPVQLQSGQRLAVHPKSYHALRWCDALDAAVLDAAQLAARAAESGVDLHLRLQETLAVRLWAWILTHAEPGIPFSEGDPAAPPAWTAELTPEDLLLLAQAHSRVNRERLTLIAEMFPSDLSAPSRLSMAGFLGTVAQELHQRPADVLRSWSLGEAFAQALTAAQAAREARARAEEQRPRSA